MDFIFLCVCDDLTDNIVYNSDGSPFVCVYK